MGPNLTADREDRELEGARASRELPAWCRAGAVAWIRGMRWRVDAAEIHDDCAALRVSGHGDVRTFLWPFDRPRPGARHDAMRAVSRRRLVRSIASALASVRSAGSLRAAPTGPRVLPYQLEPALAIAAGATRVLLADEVGLGKTIEAGWILADALARNPDARALVLTPAGLRDQWRGELGRLFGLEAALADAQWTRRALASLPADVGPADPPGLYLASIDYARQPDVLPLLTRRPWDVLVVDEAHGAAAPTERYHALTAIAAVALRIVLVSATPFSGDANRFDSLARLGAARDPSPLLLFRRSRRDVADAAPRRHRFAPVRLTAAERSLQRMLDDYTSEVWRTSPGPARLAMTVLRKRSLSSAAALARSVRRRAALLSETPDADRQLLLFAVPMDDDADELDGVLAAPGLDDSSRERRWLERLARVADAAASHDSKKAFLRRFLSRINDSAIVFTEFRDTLADLASAFPSALQLHGGLSGAERDAVQRTFNDHGGLLLATDAAAEGLNLQHRCRLVVNFELPWNPARLEQRIGRVFRIGQSRPVHALTLLARDTAEQMVIGTFVRRLERVAAVLGSGDRLAALLDDARVAQAVIGGTPLGIDIESSTSMPSCGDFAGAAVIESRRLELARVAGEPPPFIPAGLLGQRLGIAPGALFVVSVGLLAEDGEVARRLALVHVAVADAANLRSRSHAVRLLREVLFQQREAIARAAADACRADVDADRATRTACTGRLIARIEGLLHQGAARVALQAPLFDPRAGLRVAESEDATARDALERMTHRLVHRDAIDEQVDVLAAVAIHGRR